MNQNTEQKVLQQSNAKFCLWMHKYRKKKKFFKITDQSLLRKVLNKVIFLTVSTLVCGKIEGFETTEH